LGGCCCGAWVEHMSKLRKKNTLSIVYLFLRHVNMKQNKWLEVKFVNTFSNSNVENYTLKCTFLVLTLLNFSFSLIQNKSPNKKQKHFERIKSFANTNRK
jgi:hypothetical protein